MYNAGNGFAVGGEPMNTRERLMDLMSEFELDRLEVANLVRVDRDTVNRWLLPHESSNHEIVPEMAIELLELKVRGRDSQGSAA